VKVYLLFIDDEQSFFYADESEADESEAEGSAQTASGWRGWLEAKRHGFQKAWHRADSGVAGWARRAWDWLHSIMHPDESMLVRLRSTRRIDLHHPASHPGDSVADMWRGYLLQRWRRHVAWLSLNAIIAPGALVLLWPLPGPNLIGYWFAYRAIHHWLIVRGIGAVRKGRTPTHYHAQGNLDQPVELDEHGKARHEAIDGNGVRLDEYVSWTRPNRAENASKEPPLRDPHSPQPLTPSPEKPNDG
jgi:hypothetical protein